MIDTSTAIPCISNGDQQYATVKTITAEEINKIKEEHRLSELRRQKLEERLLKKELQIAPVNQVVLTQIR